MPGLPEVAQHLIDFWFRRFTAFNVTPGSNRSPSESLLLETVIVKDEVDNALGQVFSGYRSIPTAERHPSPAGAAGSAHRRPSYPSAGCVPAEPASVSLGGETIARTISGNKANVRAVAKAGKV